MSKDFLNKRGRRPNSAVVVGGILGDEGKGRITDDLINHFLKKHTKTIVYRDNGGANAGHTVQAHGKKIALHQLGSGILHDACVIVLGKDMVLHPEDLASEIKLVEDLKEKPVVGQLIIDELAVLSLDTHRAFEAALKQFNGSGKGSTGRGISPAYADVIYRHPLRMRDLARKNWKVLFKKHYALYERLVRGFDLELAQISVTRISGELTNIGSEALFLERLAATRDVLKNSIVDAHTFMEKNWYSSVPIVFEKAQALGLDKRWGVYPDITASNCAPDGIYASTQGIVNPDHIETKIAVIKSTYTSSVGSRVLPTMMEKKLAHRIREDAHEYGSTTGRPRDIAYLDIPMLGYLCKVGGIEKLAFTHMDIAYKDQDIQVCTGYTIDGKKVAYRPDQEFLDLVTPVYKLFKPWNVKKLKQAKTYKELPKSARQFIEFVCEKTQTKPFMLTFGPARDQELFF